MHCGGDSDILRSGLDSMINHYSGNHDDCRLSSPCNRNPEYVPSRSILTDPFAVNLLETWLHKTILNTHAD